MYYSGEYDDKQQGRDRLRLSLHFLHVYHMIFLASFDGQILAHMILEGTLWFVSCDISDRSRVVSRLVKINLLGHTMH